MILTFQLVIPYKITEEVETRNDVDITGDFPLRVYFNLPQAGDFTSIKNLILMK